MSSSPERSATVLATLSTRSWPLPERPMRSIARENSVRVAAQRAGRPQRPPRQGTVRPSLTVHLCPPRPGYALPDHQRRFGRTPVAKLFAGKARHVDEKVHPVYERSGDTSLVAFDLPGSAPARPPGITRVPTRARVHGADERDPGRVAQSGRHPRDGDVTVFQRLPQDFEGPAPELRELVEKEHAQVRQRHLAGPRVAPPARETSGRHGVVRRPERPAPEQRPVDLPARAVHLGNLDALPPL